VATLLVAVLTATLALVAPAASAKPAGPALLTPSEQLAASVKCGHNVGRTPQKPAVLLVHGTGTTASETWSWNLRPKLRNRGYASCTVDIPDRAWTDLQTNVEYVVHAIRAAYRKSHGKIAVIGHSQGAFLPSYALRVWPDLPAKVEDFIGYAGTYTYGTDTIAPLCAAPCAPAAHQFSPGSNLLTEISKRSLPEGPSYTAFSTGFDEVVTPQPTASTLHAPGVRNYPLQDLCPTDVADHISILAEQPFFQLTFDALAHEGPGRIGRISSLRCGFDPRSATGVTALPTYGLGFLIGYTTQVTPEEPPLRAYWGRI
jgi:pimeloyl-ACP methyl ester carboxylesterase